MQQNFEPLQQFIQNLVQELAVIVGHRNKPDSAMFYLTNNTKECN